MIDRHEQGRFGLTESPTEHDRPEEAPARFGRLINSPSVRRLAVSKIGRAVSAGAVTLVLLIVVGSSLTNKVTRWLWDQPIYKVDIQSVRFDPPPPPWIIGGRERLLISLRPLLKEPISSVDLSLRDVSAELSKNTWVYAVEKVQIAYPNVLLIKLEYRKPVAQVLGLPIYLDRYGVILPSDLDSKTVGPLITLSIDKKIPSNLREGLLWPKKDQIPEGSNATDEIQSRVLTCAELAGFLTDKLNLEPGVLPSADQITLYPEETTAIWIEVGKDNFINWGSGPGLTNLKEASLETKWSVIRNKIKKDGPLVAPSKHYFVLEKDSVRLQKYNK